MSEKKYTIISKNNVSIIEDPNSTLKSAETVSKTLNPVPEAFTSSDIWIKINDKPATMNMLLERAEALADKNDVESFDELQKINGIFEADFFRGSMMYNISAKDGGKNWNFRNKLTPFQQSLLLVPKIKLILLKETEQKIIENSMDPFKDIIQNNTNKNINNSQMQTIKSLAKNIDKLDSHDDIKNIIQIQNLKVEWLTEDITSKEAKLEIFLDHEQLIKSRVIKYLTAPGSRVRLEVSYDNIIQNKENWKGIFPDSKATYEEFEEFCKASKRELMTKDHDGIDSLIDWSIFKFNFTFNDDKSVILNLDLVQAGFAANKTAIDINVIQLLTPKVLDYFKKEGIVKLSTAQSTDSDKLSTTAGGLSQETIWFPESLSDKTEDEERKKITKVAPSEEGSNKTELVQEINRRGFIVADMPKLMIHLLWLYAFEFKKLYDKKEIVPLDKNFVINFNIDFNTNDKKRYNGLLLNQMPESSENSNSKKISISLFNFNNVHKYLDGKTTLGFKYNSSKYYIYDFEDKEILDFSLEDDLFNRLLNNNPQASLVEKKVQIGDKEEIDGWKENSKVKAQVDKLKFEKRMLYWFSFFNNIFANTYGKLAEKAVDKSWNWASDSPIDRWNKTENFYTDNGQTTNTTWNSNYEYSGPEWTLVLPYGALWVYALISIPFISEHLNDGKYYTSNGQELLIKNVMDIDDPTKNPWSPLGNLHSFSAKTAEFKDMSFLESNQAYNEYTFFAQWFYTAKKLNDSIHIYHYGGENEKYRTWDKVPLFSNWLDAIEMNLENEPYNDDIVVKNVLKHTKKINNKIWNIQDQAIKEMLEKADPKTLALLQLLITGSRSNIDIFNDIIKKELRLGSLYDSSTRAKEAKDVYNKLTSFKSEDTLFQYLPNIHRGLIRRRALLKNKHSLTITLICKFLEELFLKISSKFKKAYKSIDDQIAQLTYTRFAWNEYNSYYSSSIWKTELTNNTNESNYGWYNDLNKPIELFIKDSLRTVLDDKKDYFIKFNNEAFEARDASAPWDNKTKKVIKQRHQEKKRVVSLKGSVEKQTKQPGFLTDSREIAYKETERDKVETHVESYLENISSFNVIISVKNKEYYNNLLESQKKFYDKFLETPEKEWLEISLNDFDKETLDKEQTKRITDLQEKVLTSIDNANTIYINHNFDQNIINLKFSADYLSDTPYMLGLYSDSLKSENGKSNYEKLKDLKLKLNETGVMSTPSEASRFTNALNIMELSANSENNPGTNTKNIINWAHNKSDLNQNEIYREIKSSPVWSEKLLQNTSNTDLVHSLYDMMNYTMNVKAFFVPGTKIYMPTFIYSGGKDVLNLQKEIASNPSQAPAGSEWSNLMIQRLSPQSGLYKIMKFSWEINKYGEWISNFEGFKYEIGFLNLVENIFLNKENKSSNTLSFEDLDYQPNFFNTNFIIKENQLNDNLIPIKISNDYTVPTSIEELLLSLTSDGTPQDFEKNKWKIDSYLIHSNDTSSIFNINSSTAEETMETMADLESIDENSFDYETEFVLKRDDHPSLNLSNKESKDLLFDPKEAQSSKDVNHFTISDNSWIVNLLYSESFQEKIDNLANAPDISTWYEYINPDTSTKEWLELNKLSHNYSINEKEVEDYLHYRFIRYAWYFVSNLHEDFMGKGYKGIESFNRLEDNKIGIEYNYEGISSIKFKEEYDLYFDTFFEFNIACRGSFAAWAEYSDNIQLDLRNYADNLERLDWSDNQDANSYDTFKSMIDAKLRSKYLELKKNNMVILLSELKEFIQDWKDSKKAEYEEINFTNKRFIFNFDFINIPKDKVLNLARFSGIPKDGNISLNMNLSSFVKLTQPLEEYVDLELPANISDQQFLFEKWFKNGDIEKAYMAEKRFKNVVWDSNIKDDDGNVNTDINYFKIETEGTLSHTYTSFDKTRNIEGKTIDDYRAKYGKLSLLLNNKKVYKYSHLVKGDNWNEDALKEIDADNWSTALEEEKGDASSRNSASAEIEINVAKDFVSWTEKLLNKPWPETYAGIKANNK